MVTEMNSGDLVGKRVIPSISIALVHHPVLNRRGELITSAVTNLDIHDIARVSVTYGVKKFFVVTPLREQQQLVATIRKHWQEGIGGVLNPDRHTAFQLVEVCSTVEEIPRLISSSVLEDSLTIIGTSAREYGSSLSWKNFQKGVCKKEFDSILLLFGTASGLHPDCIALCDHLLSPIDPGTGYNHLSVRSAVSIILDRISRFQEAF